MTEKRAAIVDAALDLIRESGLGSFTQPRVARRVGLRQSHLTYYFPTRDDLLAAVSAEAVRQRIEALRAVHAATEPDEKVALLVRILVSPEMTRVLIALTQSADHHAEIRASFGVLSRGIAPFSASLLAAFGAPTDERSLRLLQATCTGISVLALARGGDVATEAEETVRALLRRLRETSEDGSGPRG